LWNATVSTQSSCFTRLGGHPQEIPLLRISEDLQLELGLREFMARVRDQTKILWLLVQWFQAFLHFAYRRALDWHTLAVHTT
jgi:hypothetical protein